MFQEEFTEDYNQRIQIIKINRFAVWDVIDPCQRKGSLDVETKNEETNQFPKVLKECSNIKAIFLQ